MFVIWWSESPITSLPVGGSDQGFNIRNILIWAGSKTDFHPRTLICMYTLLHSNCLREKQNCLHIHTRQDSKFSTHTAHTHAAHAGETSCRIARVKAISHLKGKIIYLPNKTKCVHVGMLWMCGPRSWNATARSAWRCASECNTVGFFRVPSISGILALATRQVVT